MATQRLADFIQAAPALTGAGVAADDAIPVYDRSADAMKTFTPAELSTALGGGGGLLTATVTLTDAQIKNGPVVSTTELFAALGVGQAYAPIGGYALSTIVAPYTNQTGFVEAVVGWDDDNYDAFSAIHYVPGAGGVATFLTSSTYIPMMPAGSDPDGLIVGNPAQIANVFNKNLALMMDNGAGGALTGGDPANTLKIVIYYAIATP